MARSTAVRYYEQTARVTDDSPLIIDIDALKQGYQGMNVSRKRIKHVSFVGHLALRFPTTGGTPPITGLFLCYRTTPVETLVQAVAGWNPDARPIALPLQEPYTSVAIIGAGPASALTMQTAPGLDLELPPDMFPRAIIVCQAGNVAPGPGAGSFGRLTIALEETTDRPDCP